MPGGQGAVFVAGPPQNQTLGGTYYPATTGYQLTLTNSSAPTADITGFAVVFYDSAGQELGSDRENVTETFLTSGQSLTWTEYSSTDTAGNASFGSANVPPGASTCQMVAWYHP
jgi:hypothetical protein